VQKPETIALKGPVALLAEGLARRAAQLRTGPVIVLLPNIVHLLQQRADPPDTGLDEANPQFRTLVELAGPEQRMSQRLHALDRVEVVHERRTGAGRAHQLAAGADVEIH